MRRRAPALLVALALLTPRAAAASDSFPGALASDLGLSSAPACDVCHLGATEPVGAAETPFARSLVNRGLVGGDLSSLAEAIDRMRGDGVDSDGDGAEDLDELWWGGDPNHADRPEAGYQTPPGYGCSASPARGGGVSAVAALVLLAVLMRPRRGTGASRKPW